MILLLINPGIPGRNHFKDEYFEKYQGNPKLLTRCDICNILILRKYKCGHCAFCNICVMKQDHHCPWIGKCIGKYNILIFYFFIFLLTIFLLNGTILLFLFLKNNHFLYF